MRIERYGNTRYWAVLDTDGTLVCLCVYKCGVLEVVRRLSQISCTPLVTATGARGIFLCLGMDGEGE